mmetsp:Transcript_6159/g.20743  ORF Transcript_6159/g.20743 Transcript_6159/m.20743 type:complete len:228 (-) Transcript_6159:362-1045(-)
MGMVNACATSWVTHGRARTYALTTMPLRVANVPASGRGAYTMVPSGTHTHSTLSTTSSRPATPSSTMPVTTSPAVMNPSRLALTIWLSLTTRAPSPVPSVCPSTWMPTKKPPPPATGPRWRNEDTVEGRPSPETTVSPSEIAEAGAWPPRSSVDSATLPRMHVSLIVRSVSYVVHSEQKVLFAPSVTVEQVVDSFSSVVWPVRKWRARLLVSAQYTSPLAEVRTVLQ